MTVLDYSIIVKGGFFILCKEHAKRIELYINEEVIMLSLQEARKIAKGYKIIPFSKEILADIRTPLEALRILKGIDKHCYILESVENQEIWGRYTFLGYDPKMEITCKNNVMKIKNGISTEIRTEKPGKKLTEILAEYTSPKISGLPPFTGGLVGYFSYDYVKYTEPHVLLEAQDQEGFQDMDLMLFDKVIAYDNIRQKIILIANARTDHLEEEYERCMQEIDYMIALLQSGVPTANQSGKMKSPMKALFSKEEYCNMVEKAKKYIYEGDIFQVVLSNRLEADYEGSLLNVYRMLRTTNPSPYMFYFGSEDMEVAGASPETLVKLEHNILHTFPLAGTRPRGKTRVEDEKLMAELLADEKECAEHNMLVDLGRNDLGKISDFGTVQVEKYMEIQKFSHVMHLGSTVTGKIRKEYSAIDAIDAVLPAGTLSGAPKIRAMEIIRELENNKRGIYGGAIGYIDFTGNLDMCIAIRLAYKKNGKLFVRSGAGIVADSIPEKEYQECIQKAQAVMEAVEQGKDENL